MNRRQAAEQQLVGEAVASSKSNRGNISGFGAAAEALRFREPRHACPCGRSKSIDKQIAPELARMKSAPQRKRTRRINLTQDKFLCGFRRVQCLFIEFLIVI